MPYVTTEIAGEMELFPAPKWPSAASDEFGVPLGTCWERADDYAQGRSLIPLFYFCVGVAPVFPTGRGG